MAEALWLAQMEKRSGLPMQQQQREAAAASQQAQQQQQEDAVGAVAAGGANSGIVFRIFDKKHSGQLRQTGGY